MKIVNRRNNKLKVKSLCEIAKVSRSGYYSHIKQTDNKILRELKDEEDFGLILSAYKHKGFKKGAKSVKMRLFDDYGVTMNLKKIRRLMKKYKLLCPIRKANPYRRMAKALKTSHVSPNKLQRKFKDGNPNQIFLTDISYLKFRSKCINQ